MLSKGSNDDNEKYPNSNYSIFYEKIENKDDDTNNETLDMNDSNSERSISKSISESISDSMSESENYSIRPIRNGNRRRILIKKRDKEM